MIMEKKEAMKILKDFHDKSALFSVRTALDTIIPELKESEDERIRKWIIDDIRYNMNNEPLNNSEYKKKAEKAIDWLEKQGEKTSWKSYKEDDVRRRSTIQVLEYARSLDAYNQYGKADIDKNIAWLERIGEKSQGKTALEAIKEEKVDNQNCAKPTVKVEPKFHEGDWIISHYNHVAYIKSIDEKNYSLSFNDGNSGKLSIDCINRNWRLWTIKDARKGDVLVHGGCVFIFICIENGIVQAIEENLYNGTKTCNFGNPDEYDVNDYRPATKEERDTLLKAMAYAGYTFNFEKKELKKIEQKTTEWSAFDERNLQGIIDEIEANKNQAPDYDIETYDRFLNWLKSLRPQKQWKPSEEQINTLRHVISGCSYDIEPLVELETKLKEL